MIVAILTLISRLTRRSLALAGIVIASLMIAGAFLAPAYAADIPSDDEQDVLIRSTLASFNDANMAGNYSVFLAKGSKQLQQQVTVDKVVAAGEVFRRNKLFFESIVTDDYESYEKAVIDQQGALVLAGVFKGDTMEVTYKLQFVQNDNEWKLLGINVNAKRI
jgi:hypothetical protein